MHAQKIVRLPERLRGVLFWMSTLIKLVDLVTSHIPIFESDANDVLNTENENVEMGCVIFLIIFCLNHGPPSIRYPALIFRDPEKWTLYEIHVKHIRDPKGRERWDPDETHMRSKWNHEGYPKGRVPDGWRCLTKFWKRPTWVLSVATNETGTKRRRAMIKGECQLYA